MDKSQSQSEVIDQLHQRITEGPMADRIRAAALSLAYRYQADHDDVSQDIVTAILERAQREPGFVEQTDAYIVQHGRWRARDAQKREWCLTVNAGSISYETDGVPHHAACQHNPWPAAFDWMDLHQAITRLPDRLQDTAAVILSGASPTDAAESLQVSSTTFYDRRRALIDRLAQEMRHAR